MNKNKKEIIMSLIIILVILLLGCFVVCMFSNILNIKQDSTIPTTSTTINSSQENITNDKDDNIVKVNTNCIKEITYKNDTYTYTYESIGFVNKDTIKLIINKNNEVIIKEDYARLDEFSIDILSTFCNDFNPMIIEVPSNEEEYKYYIFTDDSFRSSDRHAGFAILYAYYENIYHRLYGFDTYMLGLQEFAKNGKKIENLVIDTNSITFPIESGFDSFEDYSLLKMTLNKGKYDLKQIDSGYEIIAGERV